MTDKSYYDIACVIQYENMNHRKKTRKLSQLTLETLQENKRIRNKLGGENASLSP